MMQRQCLWIPVGRDEKVHAHFDADLGGGWSGTARILMEQALLPPGQRDHDFIQRYKNTLAAVKAPDRIQLRLSPKRHARDMALWRYFRGVPQRLWGAEGLRLLRVLLDGDVYAPSHNWRNASLHAEPKLEPTPMPRSPIS